MPKRKRSDEISHYYEVLGLDPTSTTKEDAERARRLLAREYHPDKATVRLQEINAAFDKLEEAGFPTTIGTEKKRGTESSEPTQASVPEVKIVDYDMSVAEVRRKYGGMQKDTILEDLRVGGLSAFELQKRRRDQKIELVIFAVEYHFAKQLGKSLEEVKHFCHSDEARKWAKAGINGCREKLQWTHWMHADELKNRSLWDLVNEVIAKQGVRELTPILEVREDSEDEDKMDIEESLTMDEFDWEDKDRPQRLLGS